MGQKPSTLSFKLSAAFAGLALLLTAVLMLLFSRANRYIERERRTDGRLAPGLAAELQPLADPVFDIPAVHRQIFRFLNFNPSVDVYIIDSRGEVREDFCLENCIPKIAPVDLKPILRFIGAEQDVRNNDIWFAKNPTSGESLPFSAAPLIIRGDKHFLYVTLSHERNKRHAGIIWGSGVWQVTFLTAFAMAVSFAFLGLWLFRGTSRRFSEIMKAVDGFSSGNFANRLVPSGGDELATLAAALNGMAATISGNVRELEERDRLRRELIENVWHDIKGPISGISALAQTLQCYEDMPGEERLRATEGVTANINLLSGFLEDLRELGNLETRQLEPNFLSCSLVQIVDDIIVALRHVAERKQVSLGINAPDSLPLVSADERMIARAITNLIENALRHTAPGGSVTVALQAAASGVQIKVEDTGTGIAIDELPRIFERSFQGRPQSSAAIGSSGLGLAIVQKIVEVHYSAIAVSSAPNQGTCFSFTLPYSSEAASFAK